MNEWKEAANYRRDVRHGLLNAQDEHPRIPRGKRHIDKPVVVIHRFSWISEGKAWELKHRFPTMAKAQAYMDAMNRRDANEQISRGTHPDDVRPSYYLAANQDHLKDAA